MSKDSSSIPQNFQGLLIADLLSLFAFIVSHPLYFAYLLFFLPYFVHLLSFLSPLLLPTSILLLLSLLTLSPRLEKPLTGFGFIVNACHKVFDALETHLDDDAGCEVLESFAWLAVELEACLRAEIDSLKEVEDVAAGEGGGTLSDGVLELPNLSHQVSVKDLPSLSYDKRRVEKLREVWEREILQSLSKLSQELSYSVEEDLGKVDVLKDMEGGESEEVKNCCNQHKSSTLPKYSIGIPLYRDEVGEEEKKELKISRVVPQESPCISCEYTNKNALKSDRKEKHELVALNRGEFGSTRREKEWRRTLACKLYEERQSVEGSEGMDLLWEIHEVDAGKSKAKKERKAKKEEFDENEEEDEIDSQLCCLQALRFSTRKMNLGMGRLNSMRISKAFKGMGLFVRRERKIS